MSLFAFFPFARDRHILLRHLTVGRRERNSEDVVRNYWLQYTHRSDGQIDNQLVVKALLSSRSMTNPFSTYHILPVETIVRRNVHVCWCASLRRTRRRLPYLGDRRSENSNRIAANCGIHQQTGIEQAAHCASRYNPKTRYTRLFYAVQRHGRVRLRNCSF